MNESVPSRDDDQEWSEKVIITAKLTEELHKLVPYGARPERVLGLPVLKQVSDVDRYRDQLKTQRLRGEYICDYLKKSIESTDKSQTIRGVEVGVVTQRIVFGLLFEKDDGLPGGVNARREQVITLLGIPYPLSQMNRRGSLEWALLRILAEHMVNQRDAKRRK